MLDASSPGTSAGTRIQLLDRQASTNLAAAKSIDKAIMEKTNNCVVVPCKDLGWHDIGTPAALQKHYPELI
jgi:mannose-1-phosphate guanylyltransferase